MRTQGILLVRDAIILLNSADRKAGWGIPVFSFETDVHPSLETDSVDRLLQSCLYLVHALDRFSGNLMESLQRFVTLGDTSDVQTVWASCIACLAHLAPLCHLLSQADSTLSVPMNDLCDLALGRLGNLSLEVHIEKYSHFDALTGVRVSQQRFSEMRRGDANLGHPM